MSISENPNAARAATDRRFERSEVLRLVLANRSVPVRIGLCAHSASSFGRSLAIRQTGLRAIPLLY